MSVNSHEWDIKNGSNSNDCLYVWLIPFFLANSSHSTPPFSYSRINITIAASGRCHPRLPTPPHALPNVIRTWPIPCADFSSHFPYKSFYHLIIFPLPLNDGAIYTNRLKEHMAGGGGMVVQSSSSSASASAGGASQQGKSSNQWEGAVYLHWLSQMTNKRRVLFPLCHTFRSHLHYLFFWLSH